jgi:hypothetical protein
VAWITAADVAAELGVPPGSATDDDWLIRATAAGDAWAQRRRKASGYSDDPEVVPGPDVFAGTVLAAASYYQARGSLDGSASFESFSLSGVPATTGLGRVRQLLGIDRPVIA